MDKEVRGRGAEGESQDHETPGHGKKRKSSQTTSDSHRNLTGIGKATHRRKHTRNCQKAHVSTDGRNCWAFVAPPPDTGRAEPYSSNAKYDD